MLPRPNKIYDVVSAEGAELYEQNGSPSAPHFGPLIKDLPAGSKVTKVGDKKSFREFKGGPRTKAMLARYEDSFEGWVRCDALKERDKTES